MSATNRGDARHPDDWYRTPEWCTRALIPHVLPARTMLEPGCGDGAIAKVVKRYAPETHIFGVDINEPRIDRARPHLDCFLGGMDFLQWEPRQRFDLALGNPPYGLAIEFIRHALGFCDTVSFLLRVNFLASKERQSFHRKHPSHLYVLPRRPSFAKSVKCVNNAKKAETRCDWQVLMPLDEEHPATCPKCGQKVTVTTSDATEYAWFTWRKGCTRGFWDLLQETDAPVILPTGDVRQVQMFGGAA